jgi:Predicted sugar kinase
MKILLVSRIDDPDALSFTASLGEDLRADGKEVIYEKATARALNLEGFSIPDTHPDLATIVGGDGTILLTVQNMRKQVPVLGINWGEVGFLADLEPEEARKFLLSLPREFPVEKRMRISLSMDGQVLGEALNEALIVTSRPAKMLRFMVIIDGVRAETFRADGLLMSTPTGSTAYAMSAGGPIVDPRIEGVLLVPLAPFLLSSRPHLISSDRSLTIRLESTKPAKLVIDGQHSMDIGNVCEITVRRSDSPALFVDAGRNFFEKVDRKLRRL